MKNQYALFSLLLLIGLAPIEAAMSQVNGVSVSTPVLSVTPATGDFLGVPVEETVTVPYTIKNTGNSLLRIKKIEINGEGFTLHDATIYPFEVLSDTSSALPVGNSGKAVTFSISFTAADVGLMTGKLIITYGLYSNMTHEIQLTGEGVSCYASVVATRGENHVPRLGAWYKYTADKFSIVEINTCHPTQPNPNNDWAHTLYFQVYDGCGGDIIPREDEWMRYCPYDRTSTPVVCIMEAGETINIYFPMYCLNSPNWNDGFIFTISASYPTDGDVCQNAIPLTLPVVNHFGSTFGFNHDYNSSPCSPYIKYMNGNDKVYTISLPEDGYLNGDIIGNYGAIHVLDVCPTEELTKEHCKAFAGGPSGEHFRKRIGAGTYYVIISSWSPPQAIDFLLNLSFEGVSDTEDQELMSSLIVYPNPSHDRFTAAVSFNVPTDLSLELVNLRGQVVYRNEMQAAYSIREEIDISGFAKGIYYLKVNNGKELEIRKVIVQ